MTTHISDAEARFERIRMRSGRIIAPAVFIAVLLIPMEGLTGPQHRLLAVVALVMTLWMTEALPLSLTGILAPLVMIALGIVPATQAFAPFADPIMFLFIGAFILARGIQKHGLDRRFAFSVLTHRLVGNRPSRILFAYGFACLVLSMTISNTATVAMMFPIGLAIISMLQHVRPEIMETRYASGLMLMSAFAASIGGLATPVGTPTNLIGLGYLRQQLGVEVPFFTWMSFAVPLTIILFLVLFAYLNVLCRSGVARIEGMDRLLSNERASLGPMSRAERNTLLAFLTAMFLWVLPGVLALALGQDHPWSGFVSSHIPESAAALIGAALLFFLPAGAGSHEPTLTVAEAYQIDWGVLAMYGGGIALGKTVFSVGLAEAIGQNVTGVLPSGGASLIIVSSGIATLVSELTSNVSSANMVVPLVLILGGAGGTHAAIAASMASSLGFMLPISTPTNAIVYSSGYIPLGRMVRYGLILDIVGFLVIAAGITILGPLLLP